MFAENSRMKKFIYILIMCDVMMMASCKETESNQPSSSDRPSASSHVENFWKSAPQFSADSAYHYIQYQVNLGSRVPGSKAHERCVEYLKSFFEKQGCVVELQKFTATTYDQKQWIGTNVIARYKPDLKHRILLCAHYDSRPFADRDIEKNKQKPIPGANDGASGVAVLMSIAQSITQLPLKNIGIDFVCFDLEDYGNPGGDSQTWCLGSQYWAKNLPVGSIKPQEGILLDMVADTHAIFPKEALSIQYHPVLVHEIWSIAQKAGYSNYFIDQTTNNELTDDHLFINTYAGIPCIDIVHYNPQKSDFFEHHHRLSDDMQHISKHTLKAVGQTLIYYLYKQEEKLVAIQ